MVPRNPSKVAAQEAQRTRANDHDVIVLFDDLVSWVMSYRSVADARVPSTPSFQSLAVELEIGLGRRSPSGFRGRTAFPKSHDSVLSCALAPARRQPDHSHEDASESEFAMTALRHRTKPLSR
jgi:hypothetical protein